MLVFSIQTKEKWGLGHMWFTFMGSLRMLSSDIYMSNASLECANKNHYSKNGD